MPELLLFQSDLCAAACSSLVVDLVCRSVRHAIRNSCILLKPCRAPISRQYLWPPCAETAPPRHGTEPPRRSQAAFGPKRIDSDAGRDPRGPRQVPAVSAGGPAAGAAGGPLKGLSWAVRASMARSMSTRSCTRRGSEGASKTPNIHLFSLFIYIVYLFDICVFIVLRPTRPMTARSCTRPRDERGGGGGRPGGRDKRVAGNGGWWGGDFMGNHSRSATAKNPNLP